jgi:hypothetical protein
MLKWIKNKIRKYMYDIDALAQTRDFIMGKDYQWVNTPDDTKLSKVTKVIDVFSRGGLMAVKLEDGSVVSLDELNSKLMAIMDGQSPLTKGECMSIRGPVVDPAKPEPVEKVAEASVAEPTKLIMQPTPKSAGIFEMFATEESLLNLNLRVNLPSINLLKMMYKSSQNKSEFLTELANHINNQITADHIKEALLKKLDTK